MDWQRLAPANTRRQMAVTALAGVLLGLGGVAAGTSLVQASERGGLFDFFETILRGPAPEPVAMPMRHRPAHYASLPDARRVTATRMIRQSPRPAPAVALVRPARRAKAKREATPIAAIRPAAPARSLAVFPGARTVCVRTCDGYLFPLGRLAARADLSVHEAACAAACPNAPTRLFTLGARQIDLDRAVALDGQPYRSLAVANLYRARRIEQCACQPDGTAAPPLPIAQDLTARAGDVVATATGAGIVTPGRDGITLVDFREAPGLSRRARREIDAKVDVIRREAEIRAFRTAMRSAERANRIRVAGGTGFPSTAPPIEVEPAFAPVRAGATRVVMASPFVY